MAQTVPHVPTRRIEYLCALALSLFFILFGAISVQRMSLTADEGDHYKYGLKILSLNGARLGGDDSKMPITALNALPARLAASLPGGTLKAFLEQFIVARLVTLLFSAVVSLVIFHWARSLYGFPGGLAAQFLYVLDPNIIAHSQLVTTDIYAAGMILLACYWFWRYVNSGRLLHGLICALTLGLALLTKYIALGLFPLFLVILIGHEWHGLHRSGADWSTGILARLATRVLIAAAVAVATALVVVNAGFLFNRTLMPFREYHFQSPVLQSVRRNAPALWKVPVPVPYPFLKGLDRVMYREGTGVGYGRIYLLGQLRSGAGFKGYYLVASLLKVPIASQLVVLISLVAFAIRRQRRRLFFSNELFLLLPVAFFGVYFNFFFAAQIGFRHYLVIVPLLYVFAGSLFQQWTGFRLRARIGTAVLAACLVASVASYFPQYLAYFNEFIWDRRTAYRYLSDSNLNWGQGKYLLQDYLAAHPDAAMASSRVASGQLIAIPDELVGVTVDPAEYAWLRENFSPADTVGWIYLVYNISPQQIAELCKLRSLCP